MTCSTRSTSTAYWSTDRQFRSRVHDDVGDVAVDEHLAGQEADDLVGRNAAVRAADPEVARRLLRAQPLEKVRMLGDAACRPAAIVVEKLTEF